MRDLAKTSVGEMKLREPVRAKRTSSLLEVVQAMKQRHRGAVIVEDDAGQIIGVFTERDVMFRLHHDDLEWHRRPVGEVMTPNPRTVKITTPIQELLRLMHEGLFRHVPIVDAAGRAVGVVSIRDLLVHIAAHFPEEFTNLPPDPGHEMSGRWGG
jgi:CBS domain-containing protein